MAASETGVIEEEIDFKPLAKETLGTISEIANSASGQLRNTPAFPADALAVANTMVGSPAVNNLAQIGKSNRSILEWLGREPAIARLIVEDESRARKVIYISRKGTVALRGDVKLASYDSPMGRLAELPVGDDALVRTKLVEERFYLVEKTDLHPRIDADGWDSHTNVYQHEDHGVFTLGSLRDLLGKKGLDAVDELERLLVEDEARRGVKRGITHEIRTAMGLRDQPILDRFQGSIFRLPLASQLLILGPPGTGKTTTLIKRLGQKLDRAFLEDDEKRLVETTSQQLPHENSWLMFTPSDLLKHYLKEAFGREQVPVSDERIKTWAVCRSDIARNSLGILRTPNGGRYALKTASEVVSSAVQLDPRDFYAASKSFHEKRVKDQLKSGYELAVKAASPKDAALLTQLDQWVRKLEDRRLVDSYRELNDLESVIKPVIDAAKFEVDNLIRQERNSLFNKDKEVFVQLSLFLQTLQQEDEDPDEDAVFDDDETEEAAVTTQSDLQRAVKAYTASLRSLGRNKFQRRSPPKVSRAARIREWLGERAPVDEVLEKIGRLASLQNGLRRYVNAPRRYVIDVPSSYRQFRVSMQANTTYYGKAPGNSFQLDETELDVVILQMLRNARELLSQSYVNRDLDAPRHDWLRSITGLFRNQVMVDEATDFSPLQLACMESLTSLRTRSFFACGDFNQRITRGGIRSMDQVEWISDQIRPERVNIVYRQSRRLNDFAASLLQLVDGDMSTLGRMPEHLNHEGVTPVLLEQAASQETAARWVAERIKEVERSVGRLPTIAVLVNAESEVKPMAAALSVCLEDANLKAEPCEEGKALGEGTDVRVFDIQHIKGLEFEAVFFVGLDKLAEQKPDLFDRYLYVGATRAATYLGLVCMGELPSKLKGLRNGFAKEWGE